MRLLLGLIVLGLLFALIPRVTEAQSQPTTLSAAAQANTPITAYTLPPDKLAKSKALYDLGGRLRIIGTVYGLLVLWGFLRFGVAAKFRDIAERASRFRFVQGMVFVPLFLLALTILQLPLDMYGHSVSRAYGLSVQGWASWFSDVSKGFVIGAIIFTIAAWGVTKLIRKSPQRWWFYTWLCAVPFVVFLVFIAPLVIDPLFNKFEPLEKSNPQLVTAIEQVTQRGGLEIPRHRMFLMKASEKVTTLNAYVTGFGPSKRVVVWDTTIQKATTPETLYVFGHEMGHYVLHHVVIGIAATAVGLFVGFYLLYVISNWAFVCWGEHWHMRELWDWAAVPMLLLIFSIMSLVSDPIGNGFSRQLEHNADVYGMEVTHGLNVNPQQVAAHAFQILGELSLDYPYPSKLEIFWYENHPTISDRVRWAAQYDPWSKGEQPKYVK